MCGFQGTQKPYTISGDNGERDPPVPIPNTEVKPFSADGTWLETTWESRTLPDSMKKRTHPLRGGFFFHSICNVSTLWLSLMNVRHCTWLGFFLPPAVRGSGRKIFLLHDCESRQNICQNKSFPFHREITTRCCAYLRRLVECVLPDSPVFRTLAEAERGGEGNGIPDIIRF